MSFKYFADLPDTRENNFKLLRMCAAIGVLVSHAWMISYGRQVKDPLTPMFMGHSLGKVSVFLFFAISGYLITRSFDQKRKPIPFLRARIMRIFPGLLIMLLMMLVVFYFQTSDKIAYWADMPSYLWHNLTLVQIKQNIGDVFSHHSAPYYTNVPLWTLEYEIYCYIAVLIAGMLGLLKKPAVIIVFLLIPLVYVYGQSYIRTEVLKMLISFALGAGIYLWRDQVYYHGGFVTGLIGLCLITFGSQAYIFVLLLTVCYGALWVGFYEIPALNFYNRLGDYSYGVYIYAFPMQQTAWALGAQTPASNIIVSLALTLPLAVASWHFVERRAIKWGQVA